MTAPTFENIRNVILNGKQSELAIAECKSAIYEKIKMRCKGVAERLKTTINEIFGILDEFPELCLRQSPRLRISDGGTIAGVMVGSIENHFNCYPSIRTIGTVFVDGRELRNFIGCRANDACITDDSISNDVAMLDSIALDNNDWLEQDNRANRTQTLAELLTWALSYSAKTYAEDMSSKLRQLKHAEQRADQLILHVMDTKKAGG